MTKFQKITEIGFALDNPKNRPIRTFHLTGIFNKNRLLVLAENSPKTHSLNKYNPKYGHDGRNISDIKGTCSELAAIIKFRNRTNFDLSRCSLVNIRINKLGSIANSCPCVSCANLLRYFRFREVWFTNEAGMFQRYY